MAGMSDFSISPVRAADIATVSALAREIWMQHYPGIIRPARSAVAELEQRGGLIYVNSERRTYPLDSGAA